MSTGVALDPYEGSWRELSDRAAKKDIREVDLEDVLRRLLTVPIYTWTYKNSTAGTRHMGPMAQDFYAAFGLGSSDTTITSIDRDGVTMAAIQALHRRVENLRGELAALSADGGKDTHDALPTGSVVGPSASGFWPLFCGLGIFAGIATRRAASSQRKPSGDREEGKE
jgi:hypothetical protein